MMPILTDEIRDAIDAAIDECGSKAKFAEKVGTSPPNITRWTNRDKKIKKIEKEIWDKLFPLIEKHLSVGPKNADNPTLNTFSQTNDDKSKNKSRPRQQIFNGVINVYGVPNEKVITAIRSSELTEEQQDELILKIFS